jgi:hypothetical protein
MTSFVGLARYAQRAVIALGLPALPVAAANAQASSAPAAPPSTTLSYAVPSRSAPAATSLGAPVTIAIEGGARRMLVGATVPHTARLRDASGAERRDLPVRWTSSDPNIASVNQFGVMTAVRPGSVVVRATSGSLAAERKYIVESNPVKSLTFSVTADQVKTGDVVEVSAMAFDGNGYKVPNVPYLYTFTAAVEDSAVGQLAPAELDQKGRFVAQKAGDYQLIAVAPGLVAHRTVRVSNRDVTEAARLAARLPVPGSQLSDLYAWRGRQGQDFALTCGAGARAQLVSYEVSDAGLKALDTASVDAKALTDCVVDADGSIAAVVRDNQNGRTSITLFDVSDPRSLKPLGTTDDGLGAISGIAFSKRFIYAVSDARRLDIISVEDPSRLRRVGSLELGDRAATPGNAAATDVSVSDGIAYVALGKQGMAVVDVGNGKFGGSPMKPTRVAAFHAPFSSTHAAYGYRSRTGKWYAFMSEDIGITADSQGSLTSQPGFARVIDFTDPTRPEEVARYEVPEAGVQDLWVEGERLYVAAQNGGVRVVDISADLKGNLYHQGREIARLVPADGGALPNVVAVQPVRGGLLAGDRSTGLWLVRLAPRD